MEIIGLDREIEAFCQRWQITEFAVFGSVITGELHEQSDIDVLVTFTPGFVYSFTQLSDMQDELEALFGRSVDLIDKQAIQESPNYIRRNAILESAQIVYAG